MFSVTLLRLLVKLSEDAGKTFYLLAQNFHLLHNRRQPPQGQAALVASGDHGAAQLHHDPLGVTELAAAGEGAASPGTWVEGEQQGSKSMSKESCRAEVATGGTFATR